MNGAAMFCIYCGSEIPDDSTFCPNCGATLPNEDTSTSNSNEELDDATRAFNSLAETWDNSAEQHADNELDSAIEDHTQVRFNPVVPGTTPRMGQVVPAGQNPISQICTSSRGGSKWSSSTSQFSSARNYPWNSRRCLIGCCHSPWYGNYWTSSPANRNSRTKRSDAYYAAQQK